MNWFGGGNNNKHNDETQARPTTCILMEIVSGRDLDTEHHKTLLDQEVDPYCVVRFNHCDQKLHQTSTIYNDANPIWTVKTKSLCLVDIPLAEEEENKDDDSPDDNDNNNETATTESDSIVVEVCHGSQCLGIVTIPFAQVLERCDEERKEYPVCKKENDDSGDAGDRSIQVRTIIKAARSVTGVNGILSCA